MKKFFLMATMLLTFGAVSAYAQKVATVGSGGSLQVCNLTSNNYTDNCNNTVRTGGVAVASIGNNKIAILYTGGTLEICDLNRSNGTDNCTKVGNDSGISNVQMNGDSKVIITYDNGRKKTCTVTRSNGTENCSTQ